ncbi:MAG: helix-turn-helix transcriptional regulator [Planctomycetes bacterium]|nr:helix-turn-helix transcriptional regulator [Planctomycetota bacterium]
MSKKKRPTLAEQLLTAVQDCDLTINAIAVRCGIPQPVLCRFANGTRTISLETADKLSEFFSMRLTKPVQPK